MVPKTIVSGSPMARSRAGNVAWLRRARRSMRMASVNKTRTRVASTTMDTDSASTSRSNQPRPPVPTMSPMVVNTIGPVTGDMDSRSETMANAYSDTATINTSPIGEAGGSAAPRSTAP
jgi:hypothetical protein